MKLLKPGLMAVLLLSKAACAVNPMHGWYAGLIVGASKAPAMDFNIFNPLNRLPGQGTLTYSVLGNIGGQFGYRINQFRVEGEVLYNNNPYKHLNIDGVNIPSSTSTAPAQQITIGSKTVTNPLTFKGYTNTYAVMANGFYDVYIPNYTEHLVPYLGLGLGYAHVENNLVILNDGSASESLTNSQILPSQTGFSQFSNQFAGQVIVGMSYFLTDMTSFSFDYRYLSSTRENQAATKLNAFQSRPQFYSVNFVFNSAFYLA